MIKKIAVISDIHANADALEAALGELKKECVDLTIFLGDILTYGCQPLKVIDRLIEYKSRNFTIFIKGNHDQFYFDLQNGVKNTDYKLPKFVEESISWTSEQIKSINLESEFIWRENYILGNVYFSHANPFSYGNWCYVENPDELKNSFLELQKKSLLVGIFGHSHRQMFVCMKSGKLHKINNFHLDINGSNQLIINAGSVGQPRSRGASYLILEMKGNKLYRADSRELIVSMEHSIHLIEDTSFHKETKEKLIGFLRA
jgi:predicted phosphodiesterase